MSSAQPHTEPDAVARLLAGYRPLPGVSDELLDTSGAVRPAWRSFIDHLAQMPPEQIFRSIERGDQYLRDAGVFFRQYGAEQAERAWPLSHMPVVMHDSEWASITEGLAQRADLLENIVADLYGDQRLVMEGHLPASLVAMSPEWLRPLVGVRPRSGQFLQFIAFEIARGPDGKWWVLGDRVQAPSGAGFALENRVATTRVFPDHFAEANIHRLAGFFRAFRDTMNDLRGDTESRVGILTPGRLNDTYFEHTYIARYLGFSLLEGEDLTVKDGQVMVRTIGGLEPVSVLWRRIDAAFADPLELNEQSTLGVPGLVEAVRRGQMAVVNALGSGILETRALLAFMPRIAQALLGEPLKLPNIATWWCGQEAERAHVLANADRMMIGEALSTRMLFDSEDTTYLGASLSERQESAATLMVQRGALLVGQEPVTLSTTPAIVNGQLAPRPMSLRVFLARTSRGWRAMPGGYARIGRSQDATAMGMQRGGSVADVWVVSDKPVRNETLLPSPAAPSRRARQAELPSRAADNLFWMGRYVERAEGYIRTLRAWHVRMAESSREDAPLLAHTRAYPSFNGMDPASEAFHAVLGCISAATASASQVRDRFSVDGWNALNDLSASASAELLNASPGHAATRALGRLLHQLTGFSGLVHENMYRFSGWRFLTIGRALERAVNMTGALAWFGDQAAPEGALDMVVEIGDSVLTHRRLFAVATSRSTVIDLLACDTNNPRSVLYQLGEMKEQVSFLPGAQDAGGMSSLARAILKLHAETAVATPEELDAERLDAVSAELLRFSDLLTKAYLR